MSNWISVKDDLPKNSLVDCFINYNRNSGNYKKGFGFFGDNKWYMLNNLNEEFFVCSDFGIEVTHWMESPLIEKKMIKQGCKLCGK